MKKKLLIGVAVVVLLVSFLGGGSNAPDYAVESKSPYVRDSKECMAYRVIVDSQISEEDMRLVYDEVTEDEYYLHTVWFYATEAEAEGPYTIGQLEEIEEGADPAFTRR